MNEKISKLRDSISSEILHKVQFTQIDEQNFVPIRSINNAIFVARRTPDGCTGQRPGATGGPG